MWWYNGKKVKSHADLHEDCTDFVYVMYFTDKCGKEYKYIGKKTVRSMRRIKPTKAQLAIRKNYVRKEVKDLPFVKYEGSSKETEGYTLTAKEILHQCSTKKAATYIEAALLFEEHAIFSDEYLNKNISGRFYDNDLEGLIDD